MNVCMYVYMYECMYVCMYIIWSFYYIILIHNNMFHYRKVISTYHLICVEIDKNYEIKMILWPCHNTIEITHKHCSYTHNLIQNSFTILYFHGCVQKFVIMMYVCVKMFFLQFSMNTRSVQRALNSIMGTPDGMTNGMHGKNNSGCPISIQA